MGWHGNSNSITDAVYYRVFIVLISLSIIINIISGTMNMLVELPSFSSIVIFGFAALLGIFLIF